MKLYFIKIKFCVCLIFHFRTFFQLSLLLHFLPKNIAVKIKVRLKNEK